MCKINLCMAIVMPIVLLLLVSAPVQAVSSDKLKPGYHAPAHSSLTPQILRNSLSLTKGGVYLTDDKKIAVGMVLDYGYNFIAWNQELEVSMCFEKVFTTEQHIGIGLALGFPFGRFLDFSIGPAMVKHDKQRELGIHAGVGYSYDFRQYSLGPVLEYATFGKDSHILLGISMGLGF